MAWCLSSPLVQARTTRRYHRTLPQHVETTHGYGQSCKGVWIDTIRTVPAFDIGEPKEVDPLADFLNGLMAKRKRQKPLVQIVLSLFPATRGNPNAANVSAVSLKPSAVMLAASGLASPFSCCLGSESSLRRSTVGSTATGTAAFDRLPCSSRRRMGRPHLLHALHWLALLIDGEPMAEAISVSVDRQSAGLCFREAAAIVRASPHLRKVLDVIDSRNTILAPQESEPLLRVEWATATDKKGSMQAV